MTTKMISKKDIENFFNLEAEENLMINFETTMHRPQLFIVTLHSLYPSIPYTLPFQKKHQ